MTFHLLGYMLRILFCLSTQPRHYISFACASPLDTCTAVGSVTSIVYASTAVKSVTNMLYTCNVNMSPAQKVIIR